jgi:hypothetical protein
LSEMRQIPGSSFRWKKERVQRMSSKARTGVATVVALLAFWSSGQAQTGAVLSGVVRDPAGEPVSGVVLTIVNSGSGEVRVVSSDHHGAYIVDRLHYGLEYAIESRHPRFRQSRVRARANEGETPVDITLAARRHRLVNAVLLPLRFLSFGAIGRSLR